MKNWQLDLQTDNTWPSSDRLASGPLHGLKVLDLTRILAGPFATMNLADLGADVIKVERPGTGDETRRWGPPFTRFGVATYYLSVNHNKRSLTADLADPEAIRIIHHLASCSDVVVDNFRPSTMEKFGLDHASLRKRNPMLVSATISGYGSDTEQSSLPGYDFLMQAEGGFMSITGSSSSGPTRAGIAVTDVMCGLFAAIGILAALNERARSGHGSHIEVSLFDVQIASLINIASGWLNAGVAPKRFGNAHPSLAPYETYETSDGTLAIAIGNDQQFKNFCHAIGEDWMSGDPEYKTNHARVLHRSRLNAVICPILESGSARQWLTRLIECGVPAAKVNTIQEALSSPLARDRLVAEVDGCQQLRSPIQLDGHRPDVQTTPPLLGADTEHILQALGISRARLESMRQRGAI